MNSLEHTVRQPDATAEATAAGRSGSPQASTGSHTVTAVQTTPKYAEPAAKDKSAQQPAATDRLAWWHRARFGMFIHWGPYSLLAGEWQGKRIDGGIGHGVGEWIMYNAQIPVAEYAQIARSFNPQDFDADAWVALAKRTGQKYLIITSKHHDGFALFDTQVSDYNSVNGCPLGRDIIAELAAACARHGIRFGIYYSQAQDWYHPGGSAFNGRSDPTAPWAGGDPAAGRWDAVQEGDFDAYLQTIALPQVRELLTRYGPVDIFWWDTPISMTPERAEPFHQMLQLQPDIITNNRLLNPDRVNPYSGDTETPEQFIPATGIEGRDFEVCMTVNDTWGYKKHDHNWKSTRVLIRQLVDTVSKGGNFLLNIGPDAEGRIPQPCVERMEAVGRWMDANGESIEGTQASPFTKLPWGRCTRRIDDKREFLYLHVFRWPQDGILPVPGLHSQVIDARLLATSETLEHSKVADGWRIQVPAHAPDTDASVIRLEIEAPLKVALSLPAPDAQGTLHLPAWRADIHNRSYGGQAQLDLDVQTPAIRQWTDPQTHLTWELETAAGGTFTLFARWLKNSPGSRLHIAIADSEFEASLCATPSDSSSNLTQLGTFQLPTAGRYTLSLTPVSEGWQAPELIELQAEAT